MRKKGKVVEATKMVTEENSGEEDIFNQEVAEKIKKWSESFKNAKDATNKIWPAKALVIARVVAVVCFFTVFGLVGYSFYSPEVISQSVFRLIFAFCFFMAVILSLYYYQKKSVIDHNLLSMVETHDGLKRHLRKQRESREYDNQRRKVLALQIILENLIKDNTDDEERIGSVERRLADEEKKLKELKKFLEPTKKNIMLVKKLKFSFENFLVKQCYMPFTVFLVLAVIFFLFFLISIFAFEWFGWAIRFFYSLILLFGIYYLLDSKTSVGRTDIGVKFFHNLMYQLAASGPRLAAKGFVSVVSITRQVLRYDLAPLEAKIADRNSMGGKKKSKHSQSVWFDTSVLFHLERPLDVVIELGTDMKSILKKLTGKENLDEESSKNIPVKKNPIEAGIITDFISSYIREFVAEWIETLDAAYEIRGYMETELMDSLKEGIEHYGVIVDCVLITDVRGTKEVETARNFREEENIRKDTAEILAEIKVVEARAEANSKEKIGKAEAAIIKMMGEAEAAALKARLLAKIDAIMSISDDVKDEAKKAVPLLLAMQFGEKVIPEAASALENTKLNIFAIPDLNKAVSSILGSVPFLSGLKGD